MQRPICKFSIIMFVPSFPVLLCRMFCCCVLLCVVELSFQLSGSIDRSLSLAKQRKERNKAKENRIEGKRRQTKGGEEERRNTRSRRKQTDDTHGNTNETFSGPNWTRSQWTCKTTMSAMQHTNARLPPPPRLASDSPLLLSGSFFPFVSLYVLC